MLSLSSYYSLLYLVGFIPITVGFYLIMPQKARRIVLLLASYLFFWIISGKLILFLLVSTISIYLAGLRISSVQEKCRAETASCEKEQRQKVKAKYLSRQRMILTLAAAVNLGILLILKYAPFFVQNVNSLLKLLGQTEPLPIPAFLLPVGISFYTMQALSYLFDVYRKKIPADRNPLRIALYMSFFPQIMEGPICRYQETASQLWDAPPIRYQNVLWGLQRIILGILKKRVVADRLNLLIENVFSDYGKYDGFVIAISAICYTIQLYMEFSGTMDMALGTGQIFGVSLPENFQRPFFSRTISEFWKRWHITLGAWFKDYIFYPLSMSKPLKRLTSKMRKKLGNHYGPLVSGSIALFCVWLCNGLWHGAGWQYIFFGMYHFFLILLGNVLEPPVIRAAERLQIRRTGFPYRCMQILRTSLLVCVGELFFRAESLTAGLNMFRRIFTSFSLSSLRDGSLFTFSMDKYDFLIVFVTVMILFVLGILQERGVSVRRTISQKNVVVRFAVWYALIMYIVIFGAYGLGYIPVDPIYAGF